LALQQSEQNLLLRLHWLVMEETSANSERSWLFKRANDKPKDVFNQSAWLIGLNEDYEIRPKGLDGGGTEKLTC